MKKMRDIAITVKLLNQRFILYLFALAGILSLVLFSQILTYGDAVAFVRGTLNSGMSWIFEDHSPPEGIKLGDPAQLTTQLQVQPEHKVFLPLIEYSSSGAVYYVSKTGNDLDGKSWVTAWNELDQIDWDVIQPGDTILLDGGSTEMVYATTLRIGSSGTPDKPINIRLAIEPGRDGRVVIFGGRSTPLPYCGQTDYVFETADVRNIGVLVDAAAWVVIDGLKWGGISIYGHNQSGIRLNSDSSNITVRNVEVYDNGRAVQSNGEWIPDKPGVNFSGMNITFERAIIHDNGQDALQSGGGVGNFTLRESWLYNGRRHPSVDESFNYCAHTDGIQIFNGGSLSGFLIEETIIGPGFTNGVNMGQELASNDIEAVTHNVTFRDVLFTKAADNNIMGHPRTKPRGWVIDHVTAHCPNTKWNCLYLEGSGHRVTDSIISGATVSFPDGLDTYSGNCQWNTEGFQLGKIADPRFSNVDDGDPFSLDDYSLRPNSPCTGKGSGITSVTQLLSRPDLGRTPSGLSD